MSVERRQKIGQISPAQQRRLEFLSDHRPYETRTLQEESSQKVFNVIPFELLRQIASSEIAVVNLVWTKVSERSMVVLCGALVKSISVHTLVLGGCGLSIASLKTLAEHIQNFQSLVCLDLNDNGMTDDGIIEIMRGVDLSTTIQYLYLGFNHISSRGGYAIGQSLHRRNNLISLDLSYNRLGDEGAEMIANAIASSGRENSLRFLQLTANQIGDYGAAALCHAVKEAPNLKTVYLNNNDLGEEGVRKVLDTTEDDYCRIMINTSVQEKEFNIPPADIDRVDVS